MEQHLRDRILRRIEALPDARAYQVLDYVEFLESKYAERSAPDNLFTRLSEKVEDTMRAGKAPISAISGTVGFFDGAAKVMQGIASAAQSVVDETAKVARQAAGSRTTSPAPDTPPAPSGPPGGDGSSG
jgi:hypothetical protein